MPAEWDEAQGQDGREGLSEMTFKLRVEWQEESARHAQG